MDASERKRKVPWLWIIISIVGVGVFVGLNLEDIRHRIMITSTRANINKAVTIPFSFERGLIVVQPELKGETLDMILDSGAFETRLSADTAADLAVVASINDDVGDTFRRSAQMGIASLSTFSLSDANWRRATAGILRWGEGALTPCVAKDGIVGGTTMRHASWLIDFELNQIHIGKPESLPASFKGTTQLSAIELAASGVSLDPKITIDVNGQAIENILVDTGSNGGLVLPRDLLKRLSDSEEEWLVVEDKATSGIHGVTEISAVLAPVVLKLGETTPISVYALFTDDSAPKIGTKVLSQYVMALVPKERRLYLAAREDLATENAETIGAPLPYGFIPSVSDDGEAWVVVYRERSWVEAQSADTVDPLAVGSQFAKINGKAPQEVFKDHCDSFLGIREFMDVPEMVLEREDGSQVRLSRNTP